MSKADTLPQELSELKKLLRQKDKAINTLEKKLTLSHHKYRELQDVIKKKWTRA